MNQLSSLSSDLFSNLIPHLQPKPLARLGYVGECAQGLRTAQLMGMYFDAYQRAVKNGLKGMFICDGEKLPRWPVKFPHLWPGQTPPPERSVN